ncbi:MAG: 16S rRNA processing protein RimM [Pseudomonadota bacterium]|nr:16S rRNA processing protein RimM [Pseudomonadota bacterium]MDE3037725.1 16S rRNA processing protein RimM [Pseudomonadota bacterium]
MSGESLIQVGVITAAHGVRGQVKIRSITDNPEDIFTCGALSDASGKHIFRIARNGGAGQTLIASIENVADRDAAALLRGTRLFAPVDVAPRSLSRQLIGIEARLPGGKIYGQVAGLYNFGAGDIVEINLANGKTEMLPLDKKFVDIKTGYIIVFPPDYVEPQ